MSPTSPPMEDDRGIFSRAPENGWPSLLIAPFEQWL